VEICEKQLNLHKSIQGTYLHTHKCKNCGEEFQCALPLCDGGLADPDLCPDCAEVLDGIWSR
jgi:hypothetical protein